VIAKLNSAVQAVFADPNVQKRIAALGMVIPTAAESTPEALGALVKSEVARWTPILNHFDECGVDIAYEIHPGEDLLDGASFERFLGKVDNHQRCCINYDPSHFVLQGLDYLQFIDFYHERIKAFHVKDAELNPTGRQGAYGGFEDWVDRAGRFRSLGDGEVDFSSIFSKLTAWGFTGIVNRLPYNGVAYLVPGRNPD